MSRQNAINFRAASSLFGRPRRDHDAMRRSTALKTCLVPLLRLALLSACSLLLLAAQPSAVPPVALPSATVQSLFYIAKSENKNQVHYAVVVDAACHPVGSRPVYGYWRELEVGPRVVSSLLEHEQRAYGLNEPRFVRRTTAGGEIRISLRGFPERPLIIEAFRQGSGCAARTQTTIQRQPALLKWIYVNIGFLFSVNYAIVRGVRIADGVAVQEKIHD
jgi:hypothetical protein